MLIMFIVEINYINQWYKNKSIIKNNENVWSILKSLLSYA